MTSDEIVNMPAGNDLDALVAEKVMGWTWRAFQPAHEIGDLVRRPYPPDWSAIPRLVASGNERLAGGWDSDLPRYSTDIAAAWEVVDRMVELGDHILGRFDGELDGMQPIHTMNAVEASLSICRAALLAVMVKGE